ncbi:MAG: response regulator [Acidobacteria bacterium]|nr:response regulator [Acidobacteriota bacterium]
MSHKLLLADDSVTIQRVIELTFSGEDVQVVTVGDGEQAIARIPAERPDIVLADIGMPKRSGYDVAAFVKGHPDLGHIPVLLLAGAFEPVDEARAEQVGCDGVLVKPFEPQQVIARVRELLEGARGTPTRATADVPRPVERLAPRTLEFPRREEARPAPVVDRDAVEDFDLDAIPPPGERAASSPAPDESLDDYFDRLDAAFATLDGAAAPSPPAPRELDALDDRLDIPTLDEILGADFAAAPAPAIDLPLHPPPLASLSPAAPVTPPPVEPPDITPTRAPQGSDLSVGAAHPAPRSPMAEGPPARSLVADAFTALLAVEQGEPGAAPVRLTSGASEPAVTDALVDEVTRRVLERLAPSAARDVVVEIVSRVAERLVREEIERIRSRQ